MSIAPEDRGLPPASGAASSAQLGGAEDDSGRAGSLSLPAGWQPLATGMPDTWLYRIKRSGVVGVYWQAVMTLHGKRLHRRFASELHARAWLTVTIEPPRASATPYDLEELHGSFRAAALLRGG